MSERIRIVWTDAERLVVIDGQDVTALATGVSFAVEAGDRPVVTVTFAPGARDLRVEIDAEADVPRPPSSCGFTWGDGVVEPVQVCTRSDFHVGAHLSRSGAIRSGSR